MDLRKLSKVADGLEPEKPHPMQPIADMANLSASFTGLPVKVWISSKFERHSPRMKAYLDSNTTVSISISATPQILSATGNLNGHNKTISKIKKWVAMNVDVLLDYWNDGSLEIDVILSQLKRLQ